MTDNTETCVEGSTTAAEGPDSEPDAPNARGSATHPSARSASVFGLALGALGVVFGDIGTSPLYAMQTVFSLDGGTIKPNSGDVYGIISLVFWSITIVVSIKYVAFVMRADNDGEGGVMALAALARRFAGDGRLVGFSLLLGVFGASLFFGDSVITPAISVLSAVEGLEVASPGLADAVVPIALVIIVVLFVVQRFGTHTVGRFFGPVMLLWFLVLAVTGLPHVIANPAILRALSPTYIGAFVADHPFLAFIALGAVVLSITGAEALYADMGHFGRAPIRRSWFVVVFPCLTVNYLGQGAMVLDDAHTISNPFFLLGPSWARIPLVVLATLATVIASQAVISGAFSIARQAVRLGFLPNLTVRHTSTRESGQIYVPAINWLLFASVLTLVVAFESSQRLATLYGFAVTGTFLIDTTLFLVVAATMWRWARWKLVTVGVVFGVVELAYFGANATKILSGGWLPLLIAAVISTVMTTWQAGRRIVTDRRRELEGPLQAFVDELHEKQLHRVPGTAVFPHPTKETTPLALRQNVEFNQVLHDTVILVSVRSENVPYISPDERITVDPLVHQDDGITHIDVRFGFQDDQDIPEMLRQAVGMTDELDFDPETASYFLSRLSIERGEADGLATWRKRLFIGLAHNAANPAMNFGLPIDRTTVMGAHLDL
ncbi:KUP system potassium uptake protein [Jatrophihabitans endophyticus]|uniref:Probable potassium transport system protein Kup n=2 Tax=Jatrophihabitans endophyticus TaxID=1206085 RepID=A0A1M5KP91_9ACTN|nr:potassium transporter Kup [Jatrophihabitans endophyticus]SHG54607.1 KUP system potassium uptake protein [Jatrophihabitans endophyticus]